MRKLLFVLVLSLIAIVGVVGFARLNVFIQEIQGELFRFNSSSVSNTLDEIEYYQNDAKSINIAIFRKDIEFYFTPQSAQTLQEQAKLNGLALAVNGGYFLGSYIDASHAGLLQIRGNVFELAAQDNQLTHVITFNHQNGDLNFVAAQSLDQSLIENPNYSLVQTGPLFIDRSQVQSELITNSLNGDGRYLRTVLGFTSDGRKFIAITKASYTLTELAGELLKLPQFAGSSITAINLDGGSSTAMYSNLPKFNFAEQKRLPAVIGVR